IHSADNLLSLPGASGNRAWTRPRPERRASTNYSRRRLNVATVWFCLVAFMLIAYVLLDGFDLGAGIVHLLVARTNDERRNVIRGVPLREDHYFFESLWTNFQPGPDAGVLDWYTVLAGIVALVALTMHGANYLAVKTEGDLALRSRKTTRILWPLLALLTIV